MSDCARRRVLAKCRRGSQKTLAKFGRFVFLCDSCQVLLMALAAISRAFKIFPACNRVARGGSGERGQFLIAPLLAQVMNICRKVGDLLVGVVGVLRHCGLKIRETGAHDRPDQVSLLVAPH